MIRKEKIFFFILEGNNADTTLGVKVIKYIRK